MFTSFSFSEDTVGFMLTGTFDDKIVERLHQEILEKLQTHDKINLYIEYNGIDEFTLPSLLKELIFKLKHTDDFDKVALVADEKWIKLCASMENLFLSSNIKNFDVEDRLKAINWIAQRDR
ncbi:STAS/SEC14 domain-containing protein [Candidatus Ulvibacter alkanivorans]|uniref:STAS/SEC14 domain-containing protein n=1 Tax=Candidatus Ulvibacter alkanivorans TaxID=2267620 RepID=UPI000DF4C0AE|nr:STAS/SEC14 domain-containing protein [Candidatus Ulvibacter alkanivorans]